MPLKNIPIKNRSRKHPGFNQASKAERLGRKEEERKTKSCDIATLTNFGEEGLVYPACENKFKKLEMSNPVE
ncbi:hypothetical protein NPIL_515821 [Nephila pilipes]|uniref:Uncharacterized protein n=1 Tax=Nephila pilipes TaxID=299642 RepID=A0A8X6UEQ8_NEPPI|nr:hypothetical protein NPIL_515821 [Nephila pilipes]